jgi:hypothetical protein
LLAALDDPPRRCIMKRRALVKLVSMS